MLVDSVDEPCFVVYATGAQWEIVLGKRGREFYMNEQFLG